MGLNMRILLQDMPVREEIRGMGYTGRLGEPSDQDVTVTLVNGRGREDWVEAS